MGYLDSLEKDRRKKLDLVRELGHDPYGSKTQAESTSIGIVRTWSINKGLECVLRGRITSKNNRGKLKFFFLQDMTAEIQIMFSKADYADEKDWTLISQIDVFDHIEVHGVLTTTQTGELTVSVRQFAFMGKSIAAPPEKFHGIKNDEVLIRQRYLAMIQDPSIRDRLRQRSNILTSIRHYLQKQHYIEVETPILSAHANGANARPFSTFHNTLDEYFNLRIAPELDLKRLLVGGMERIYEIGRVFRNEGIDATHNPEFTILECYEAYADANRMMQICEEILRAAWEPSNALPFLKMSMRDLFFNTLGLDLFDPAGIKIAMSTYNLPAEDYAANIDRLLDHQVLPRFIKKFNYDQLPLFISDFPAEVCPLARRKSDQVADRFELYVFTKNGFMEVANGYSELNDPDEQLKNFMTQASGQYENELKELKVSRPEDPQVIEDGINEKVDYDYINALKIGMPRAGGLGIGIDRLVMLATRTDTIRDVIAFPLVKPKKDQE
jgi:lysyl-tRNA synthetase class 2